MAKMISLPHGYVAVVDDADYETVSAVHWSVVRLGKNGKRVYAVHNWPRTVNGRTRTMSMHRFIMSVSGRDVDVDHIDHDGLNNQRSNLRVCTRSQNLANGIRHPGKYSKYRGVTLSKPGARKRWRAQISVARKRKTIGLFETELGAAAAYNASAWRSFGEFAILNALTT